MVEKEREKGREKREQEEGQRYKEWIGMRERMEREARDNGMRDVVVSNKERVVEREKQREWEREERLKGVEERLGEEGEEKERERKEKEEEKERQRMYR